MGNLALFDVLQGVGGIGAILGCSEKWMQRRVLGARMVGSEPVHLQAKCVFIKILGQTKPL